MLIPQPNMSQLCLSLLFLLFALAVVVPSHATTAASESQRLIETGETSRQWMTESEVRRLKAEGVNFMDITDFSDLGLHPINNAVTLPTTLTIGAAPIDIRKLISELSADQIASTITELSDFYTRYYRSATGVAAAKRIHERYLTYAGGASHIQVEFVEHTWAQPSVVARIQGVGNNADEIVVLGGHEDSILNSFWNPAGRAPGADDDASGTATVLEVFRVLTKNGYRGNRTLEFHAYAAEEAGLLGSQDIASRYARAGKKVAAMMQLDMVGYVKDGKGVFGIMTDYVDATLTQFLRNLVKEYANIPTVDTRCGYACSDHASWNKAGYPAVFPAEAAFSNSNPYIHTEQDILSKIDPDHALEFSKVALAFLVELSSQ